MERTERGRTFYLGMGLVMAAITVMAFGSRYYLKVVTGTTGLPPLVHAHAIANSAWIALVVAQAGLVATGRLAVHRRLGVAGAALAVAIVLLGVLTAIKGGRDGWNPAGTAFPDGLAFMLVGLRDIGTFAVLVGGAVWYRRRPELHKRLMVLATVSGLAWPALTRVPFLIGHLPAMLAIFAALIVAPAVHDGIVDRRIHAVSLWGGLGVMMSFLLVRPIAVSSAWHELAVWITR